LRTTAFPTRRLTVTPSRALPPAASEAALSKTNPRPDRRSPRRESAWNSLDRRIRSARGNGPVAGITLVSTASTGRVASDPWRGDASGPPGPRASSSAPETRGPDAAGSGWADTCVSWEGNLGSERKGEQRASRVPDRQKWANGAT
jgi:hypothetical protein